MAYKYGCHLDKGSVDISLSQSEDVNKKIGCLFFKSWSNCIVWRSFNNFFQQLVKILNIVFSKTWFQNLQNRNCLFYHNEQSFWRHCLEPAELREIWHEDFVNVTGGKAGCLTHIPHVVTKMGVIHCPSSSNPWTNVRG